MRTLLCLLVIILALSTIIFGQDDRYEALLRQAIVADSFFVDFFMRTTIPPSQKIGNSTFFINYNSNALEYLNKVQMLDGPWDEGMHSEWYDNLTITNRADLNRLALNINRKDEFPVDGGILVPDTLTRIGSIKFLIKNNTLGREIEWNPTYCAITDYSGYVSLKSRFTFNINQNVVPVELNSFAATSIDASIELTWITRSETDNLGFNILRADSEHGSFKRVNARLISGAGNTQNECQYKYIDREVEVNRTYYYRLQDVDYAGRMMTHDVINIAVKAPEMYALHHNYPNPFNPTTTIGFKLKETGLTTLEVYNIKGQVVKKLIDTKIKAGVHSITWDGTDMNGILLPSGVYFYRMRVNDFRETHKMQFLR
ncbi:T9SS type A sorting domain-containing protein [candidate division KSB1 bacterium]|nr:T9SS type A sorting domain-containing protein [candidate division KSB1 bacterium]